MSLLTIKHSGMMLENTAGRSCSVLNRIILAAKRRCKSPKKQTRKDVTLSSTQSVGFEPTSRINDRMISNHLQYHYGNSANKLNFYAHIQIRLSMYTISMKPNPTTLALSLFHVKSLQNHKIIRIIMQIKVVVTIFKAFILHLRHVINNRIVCCDGTIHVIHIDYWHSKIL